jgi:hypothetical protein
MPNINEFFSSKVEEVTDNRVEKIDQSRPCSKCELTAPFYSFNQVTLEMYWTCSNGHETRHKLN